MRPFKSMRAATYDPETGIETPIEPDAPTPREVLADALMTAHWSHTQDCSNTLRGTCTCHFYEDLSTVRAAITRREPLNVEDVRAALDAEGWLRGLSEGEAERYAIQLHARLEAER